jgi:hypothetical protein
MTTFAQRVLRFNTALDLPGPLIQEIKVMNPFKDNPEIGPITEAFYTKFYSDNLRRKLILGINPGRLGAGATGIPFTDTKRLVDVCKINISSFNSHEPSSVFVYRLIAAYGGVDAFYRDFYINSVCPLGFIEKSTKGNWVNRNYYDYKDLFEAVRDFIISSIKGHIALGVDTDTCFVLGKKNAKFLKIINDAEHLFNRLLVLDHPRYIVQYKSKLMDAYIADYLKKLRTNN